MSSTVELWEKNLNISTLELMNRTSATYTFNFSLVSCFISVFVTKYLCIAFSLVINTNVEATGLSIEIGI